MNNHPLIPIQNDQLRYEDEISTGRDGDKYGVLWE
jgi:hypothetical protein